MANYLKIKLSSTRLIVVGSIILHTIEEIYILGKCIYILCQVAFSTRRCFYMWKTLACVCVEWWCLRWLLAVAQGVENMEMLFNSFVNCGKSPVRRIACTH